jgi:hypothetical protein
MAQTDYPVIRVRTNHAEYKKFKILQDHGYSHREVLEIALSSYEDTVTVVSKKTRELITFPRAILTKRKKVA